VLGLTLLERAILSCKEVGVQEFYVVIGYHSDKMIPYLSALEYRLSVLIKPVENQNWREGNGSSALSAAPYISRPFLLLMCDHLFDPAIIQLLLTAGTNTTDCLLAVDRHTDRVFDLDDATKVQMDGDVITGIGKEKASYDAVDTGLFLCQPSLFDALEVAKSRGQHSLSAGVVELIKRQEFRAVTIGKSFWFDVDTPKSLGLAKKALLQSLSKPNEDGFVARYLNRPASRRISEILVSAPISPNGISLLSFAVGIIGAIMFSLGGYIWTILAGLVIQLSSIVDGCDGEVARLRFQSSKFGGWFDTILDRYADTAIVAGVSFGYWLSHPHAAVWLGAIFALTGFIMTSYTKKEFVIRYQSKPPSGIFGKLIKRDLRIFAIMLGAIVNLPYEIMLLAGLLSHVGIGWILLKGHRQMT
jgi:CDP-L-myo-inositol myo-inositolphosphotransferase